MGPWTAAHFHPLMWRSVAPPFVIHRKPKIISPSLFNAFRASRSGYPHSACYREIGMRLVLISLADQQALFFKVVLNFL
jgi:hypothetical protein